MLNSSRLGDTLFDFFAKTLQISLNVSSHFRSKLAVILSFHHFEAKTVLAFCNLFRNSFHQSFGKITNMHFPLLDVIFNEPVQLNPKLFVVVVVVVVQWMCISGITALKL